MLSSLQFNREYISLTGSLSHITVAVVHNTYCSIGNVKIIIFLSADQKYLYNAADRSANMQVIRYKFTATKLTRYRAQMFRR